MKRLFTLLFTVALLFTNCDNKKKGLTAQYDELIREGDSIEAAHQDFMKTHNKMSDTHQEFTEKLKGMELKDSSVLEDIAKHDVILKRHDAIIKAHVELFDAHKNLKSKLENMTDTEMQAKIEEMEQGHDKIINEHDTMEKEHQTMMEEHKAIEKTIEESKLEPSEED